MKKPFVSRKQLEKIIAEYPTPFHLYDEKGIRETARALARAFSWNPGFREYFAVKATPTPAILNILKEEGCGCDCASLSELMLADRCGFSGESVMFSSNDTPEEEYLYAYEHGAVINLDDVSHIEMLKRILPSFPKKMSCRFNPGGVFTLGSSHEEFQVMDVPQEAKFGMTRDQIFEAFRLLKDLGVREFGIHAFLASNTLSDEYYPSLAAILFQLAADLTKETGCRISFINLSGGIGIPYRPEDRSNDIYAIGEGVRKAYEKILKPAGMDDVAVCTELGRFMLGPSGCLVSRVRHIKHTYRDYAGIDACSADLMRPAMYGAYHHITVMGKENEPVTSMT